MLSVKKVKLHGMQDVRWETKDKIVQYKGLVNLFSRDRKIIEVDNQISKKKQRRFLKQVHKNIINDRKKLDNATNGDRQQLRNTLQEHKSLQLAYQNLYALDIINHISQDNFNKRKDVDRLSHKLKLRIEKLINLKIDLSKLEDEEKFDLGANAKDDTDTKSRVITAKVQDAVLKVEAAISVRNTYREILNIMKKDGIYFDAVLKTLQRDAKLQGHCMYRTIQMGQLATEYLDDRKSEFKKLEICVRRDMKARNIELAATRDSSTHLRKRIGVLVRRDSDVNVVESYINQEKTPSELDIIVDLDRLKDVFSKLQNVTKVLAFEAVYPCIIEQKRQYDRLKDLSEVSSRDYEVLLRKTSHAEVKYIDLTNTMVESTYEYKERKRSLIEDLEEVRTSIAYLGNTKEKRGEKILMVRKCLDQLSYKLKIIPVPLALDKKSVRDDIEDEGFKVLSVVTHKIQLLLTVAAQIGALTEDKKDSSEEIYEKLVFNTSAIVNPIPTQDIAEGLMESFTIEDSQIPTREYIKSISNEIVLQFSADEEGLVGQKKGSKR